MSGPDPDSDLEWFTRQVRARSCEHRRAMPAVCQQDCNSVAVGILRQELDSMVRVIYLLSEPDRDRRAHLIHQAVSGQRWRTASGDRNVWDADMVSIARRLRGNRWALQLYNFGCGFIHLSSLHDYQARDPFRALPNDERHAIAEYIREEHGDGVTAESTFSDIMRYVPRVLDKIASRRLERYLDDLEHDRDLP